MTVVINIRPQDMGKLEEAMARNTRATIRTGLRVAGQDSVRLLRAETATKRIYGPTRQFASGWGAIMPSFDQLLLRNVQPYAVYVENGRRAGARMPPIEALIPWVRMVMHVPENRVRSVAFAVAKKIGLRGIRARRVMTSPQVKVRIRALVTRAMLGAFRAAATSAAARAR